MSGKIHIEKLTEAQIESVFYWPVSEQCTENDHHGVMDFLIIWRFIQDHQMKYFQAAEIKLNIINNLDNIIAKWLLVTNSGANDQVLQYSIILFKVIIDKIWNSGLNINLIRQYYPVFVKGSRDVEENCGLGFMKMIFSKIVIIPTAMEIDGILRKRPVQHYAITTLVLSRKRATVDMIRDYLEVKEQVETKE